MTDPSSRQTRSTDIHPLHPLGAGESGTPPGGAWPYDLIDLVSGFLGVVRPDGVVVEANRSALAATGLRRDEVVGRPFWDADCWARSPAVRDQLRADFAEALRGRPVRRETTYFTAVGEERVVDRTLSPVTDPSGRVVLVLAEGRDVTDRTRAEEALARTERRLRGLLEYEFGGVALVGADGSILYRSPAARPLLGYGEPEVLGRDPLGFVHPDDRDRADGALAAVLRAPRSQFRDEFRVRHADGSWRWVEVVARNLLDDPALRAVVCNYRDVTEQKQAAAAVRAGEERFRGLFDQSAAGMAEADLAGRFVLVNRRFCEMVGRPPDDLYRLRVEDVTHPDDWAANQALFARAVRAGGPFVIEKRYVRPDGSAVWVRTSVTAVRDPAGTPRSVLGVAVEITAQRRAEEALRRARDELEDRVRARTAELEAERTRLEEVFRLAPAFVAVLRGPEHMFERANDRYHDLVGRRDLLGRPIREALPELAGQGYYELLDRVYRTGEPFHGKGMCVLLLRDPGGPPVEMIVDFVYQPLRGPDGGVTGVLVQGIDQTSRARAEEVLRGQAELLDLASDAILVLDPAGTVTYWNRGAERLYGWARDEAVGRNAAALLGTVFPRPRPEIVAEVARVGRWEGDLTQVRRDGTAVVVASRWTRRDGPGGGLAAVLQINTDVTELRQAARVREEFVKQMIAAQEEERKRVARELHDGVAQTLSALQLGVGTLAPRATVPEVREGLAGLARMAQAAAEEVRFLARGLRPPALDELGLLPALSRYAEDFGRAHGLRVEVDATGDWNGRVPPEVETALYRIAQEALSNAARHAGATAVSVILLRQPAFVQLLVEDDGRGWDPAAQATDSYSQLGLQGMVERAAMLGGSATVEAEPDGGTAVCARLPLPENP